MFSGVIDWPPDVVILISVVYSAMRPERPAKQLKTRTSEIAVSTLAL